MILYSEGVVLKPKLRLYQRFLFNGEKMEISNKCLSWVGGERNMPHRMEESIEFSMQMECVGE